MTDKENITEYSSELLGERYFKVRHKSGLDVYVYPKDMVTSYALFATRYGAFDDKFRKGGANGQLVETPSGVAHYLEHRLFANEDGSDSFEKFSAFGADANAYTSYDKTVYLFSCTENFEQALRELVTFVTHPYFTKENVDKERGIISQEINMNTDNPYVRCAANLYCAMYEHHPIRCDIGGTLESISRITPEMLGDCYNTFYKMSDMVLIVCGDHTPEEVISIIDKLLPDGGVEENVLPERRKEKREACIPRTEQKMNVGKTLFTIGIKDTDIPDTPMMRIKKETAMTVLNEILFSRAGRFFSQCFESGLIGASFSCDYSLCRDVAFNLMFGESDDPDRVLSELLEYIADVRKEGLSREDFERSKKVLYAGFLREFDSTEDIANNMVDFIFDGVDLFDYLDIIKDVAYEDVCSLLDTQFDRECISLSVISPL